MALGYPEGLKGNTVPYMAQIIKVADEYDAIVTKRQYKTHIHISETLKLLIKDAQINPKTAALDQAAQGVKVGRLNRRVVRSLFKVVIQDTQYEISCVIGYLDFLKSQIKRLNEIEHYHEKMLASTTEQKKNYFKEGMRMLFADGENFENYSQVLTEYNQALIHRQEMIDQLYDEIKIIKN